MRFRFLIAVGLALLSFTTAARADDVYGPSRETMQLHLRADPKMTFTPGLYTRAGKSPFDQRYELVCTAPCDPVLPYGTDVYVRVDENGKPIERRLWRGYGGEADLVVAPDTGTAKKVGWLLVVLGAAACTTAAVGAAVIVAEKKGPDDSWSELGAGVMGFTLGLTGLALLLPGIAVVTSDPPRPTVRLARHAPTAD